MVTINSLDGNPHPAAYPGAGHWRQKRFMKNEFVIKTKTLTHYFRGEIMHYFSPIDRKKMWVIVCSSYGGGYRKDSPLNVLDWKITTKKKLMKRLTSFVKRGRYTITFSPSKF